MTWDDGVRLFNLIGSLFSLWLLSTAAFRQWSFWNRKTRVHWLALVGWVVLGVESSVETLIRDVAPGPRTILTTLVVVWTLRALLIEERLDSDPTIPWKGQSE